MAGRRLSWSVLRCRWQRWWWYCAISIWIRIIVATVEVMETIRWYYIRWFGIEIWCLWRLLAIAIVRNVVETSRFKFVNGFVYNKVVCIFGPPFLQQETNRLTLVKITKKRENFVFETNESDKFSNVLLQQEINDKNNVDVEIENHKANSFIHWILRYVFTVGFSRWCTNRCYTRRGWHKRARFLAV